ncbi:MAG: hypothetical protein ABSD12_08525 [Paraburkholderia sp.]|jgi:hypothetical protein
MIFVRQIKKRPANPVVKATEFGGRRCPKARDQGVTFAAMLAGPSLIRRADLSKGHAKSWIQAQPALAAGVLPISERGRARCTATHFDADQHNSGAVQHFIRAACFVNAATLVSDSGHRRGGHMHGRSLAWILPLIECAATMSAHEIKRLGLHRGPRVALLRQDQDNGVPSFNTTSGRRLHLAKRTY